MTKTKKHDCVKETEILLIQRDNDYIKQRLDDIYKALIGNGKPGLRSDMRHVTNQLLMHEEIIKQHATIINGLNTKLAYYAGAIAVIVFIITWVPKFLL